MRFLIVVYTRAVSLVKNLILRLSASLLFTSTKSPKKVLLFRTGSIGDNICAMPAIVSIRRHFKDAELHILTNAGGKNLVSLENLLSAEYYDRIIDYSGTPRRALLRILKEGSYDLVIELPQDQASLMTELRNMLFFRLAGIRSGFGWEVNTI